ncbi:MAG: TauD/TfdA family dioxygenase, partial [Hyphomicrobiales bacterium]
MNIAIQSLIDRHTTQKVTQCGGGCRCTKPKNPNADMADLRMYNCCVSITSAQTTDDVVVVKWSDGTTDQFHHGWLRENDPSPASRHPISRERIVKPLSIPAFIRPKSVCVHSNGALSVTWSEHNSNHTSLFDAGWLRAHSYCGSKSTQTPNQTRPDRPSPAIAVWHDLLSSQDALRNWLDSYLLSGWSIVVGVPHEDGAAVKLGQRIGTVRSSNFGFSFDVKSKAEPISNAYTSGFLPLHTDLPHYQMPPGLQILHCLQNEAEGGESLLADGLAVADLLAREEPETFRILTNTTVPYRFQDADSDYITRHPIIECDETGHPVYINWSNSTIAPLDTPFDAMPALRAAIRRFVTLIESPRFLIERKLRPGEALVFDNRRMLH